MVLERCTAASVDQPLAARVPYRARREATMSMVLHVGGESVIAAWRWEAAEGHAIEMRDRHAALGWLRRVAGEAGAMMQLRRLAMVPHALLVHSLDDAEVLDWLALQIEAGQLRLVARPRVALGTWGDVEELEQAP